VVLYSAQDQEFAEGVLADFTQQTGLSVAPKYDTEAAKSVALYAELLHEEGRPRCDVFWNNEVLNTILLQRRGMLQPYDSPTAEPFPASARARDNTWHAFASRARVLLVNTKLLQEKPTSLLDLTQEKYRGQVVMAKPNAGTTATQAACLFEVLGDKAARQFYKDLHANDVQIAPGNKQVAEWVGEGRTPTGRKVVVGMTDTDDAMDEVRKGRDVAIVFPDGAGPARGRMGTLFIPNTLAILKDCPNPEGAKRLVDFLLSPEIEARLAESDSCQIPLNPQVKAKLPPQIQTPRTVRPMDVDFEKAADLLDKVQAFLHEEFGL
jgi:iron(III) transport system substrate-binding protein